MGYLEKQIMVHQTSRTMVGFLRRRTSSHHERLRREPGTLPPIFELD